MWSLDNMLPHLTLHWFTCALISLTDWTLNAFIQYFMYLWMCFQCGVYRIFLKSSIWNYFFENISLKRFGKQFQEKHFWKTEFRQYRYSRKLENPWTEMVMMIIKIITMIIWGSLLRTPVIRKLLPVEKRVWSVVPDTVSARSLRSAG